MVEFRPITYNNCTSLAGWREKGIAERDRLISVAAKKRESQRDELVALREKLTHIGTDLSRLNGIQVVLVFTLILTPSLNKSFIFYE